MEKRLLVVEDDEGLRKTVVTVLSRLDLKIHEVSDGLAALSVLSGQTFHVILTDIKMPGMDGLEFVGRLKEKKLEIPVIFYSAYADKETLIKVIKLGAFDFIEKPFKNETLVNAIQDALMQSDSGLVTKLENLHLKKRDIEILRLVMRGLSNKEIAGIVNLSEQGVKYHMTVLLEKFGTTNRIELRNKVQNLVGP